MSGDFFDARGQGSSIPLANFGGTARRQHHIRLRYSGKRVAFKGDQRYIATVIVGELESPRSSSRASISCDRSRFRLALAQCA